MSKTTWIFFVSVLTIYFGFRADVLTYAGDSSSTERILFIHSSGQLWATPPTGESSVCISDPGTSDSWVYVDFDVSSVRREILYVVNQLGKPQPTKYGGEYRPITLVRQGILNIDTGERRELAIDAECVHYCGRPKLRWSPDGKSIAFINNFEVYLYDLETTSQTKLSSLFSPDPRPVGSSCSRGDTGVVDFSWSPDGRNIAVHICRLFGSGVSEIGLVPVSSGGGEVISKARDADRKSFYSPDWTSAPKWTPDGKVMWTLRDYRLFLYDLEKKAGAVVPEFEEYGDCRPCSLSPDERYLAFTRFRYKEKTLLLRILDTSNGDILFSDNLTEKDIGKWIPIVQDSIWLDSKTVVYDLLGKIYRLRIGERTATPIAEGFFPEDGHFILKDNLEMKR